jgi:purine nucleosidase
VTTVHGNCTAQQGTHNALALLAAAGAGAVAVYQGCELPLLQPSLLAPETHGDTGLGYAVLPDGPNAPAPGHAVDYLIETILAAPGEITLVAVAPLTNVALAIRREPRIVPALKDVIIMGGAIRHQGNTTPLAEFNTYVDPHAAHIVFHAGLPITLVPLDVTYQCVFSSANVQHLLGVRSPVSRFIADSTRFYMEFHDQYQKIEGCVINDPLALALVFAPDLCDYETHYVDVDISTGVSLGKTYADFYSLTNKPANMRVALGVRAGEFLELFMERMENLSRAVPAGPDH